jgi:hypothetical protein
MLNSFVFALSILTLKKNNVVRSFKITMPQLHDNLQMIGELVKENSKSNDKHSVQTYKNLFEGMIRAEHNNISDKFQAVLLQKLGHIEEEVSKLQKIINELNQLNERIKTNYNSP